jgi:hypothetical protein
MGAGERAPVLRFSTGAGDLVGEVQADMSTKKNPPRQTCEK